MITSDNLLLSIVDTASFQRFVSRLNPYVYVLNIKLLLTNIFSTIQPVSCCTLTQDLEETFLHERQKLYIELSKHIESGGRISLITDI
jgi:hypothetical protein